jgi:hypothetical protein
MKKIYLGLLVVILSFFTLYMARGIVRKLEKQKLIESGISRIPFFSFRTLDDRSYNSSEITKGPVLVVHFHPECEHCQYEISEILKNNIPASFSKVLLVSSAHPDSIRKLLDPFNYTSYPSVIPLFDAANNFEEIFGSGIVPAIYIYDIKLNLIKGLHGEVKTESILKYLKERETDKQN